jgi:type I restriction enzyme R subunit
VHQVMNNAPEQAVLGDFQGAFDDAVMESSEAHQNMMNQVLSNKSVAAGLGRLVFDLLVAQTKWRQLEGPPSSRRG